MKRILLMAAIILLTLGSIGCGSYTSLRRPEQTAPDRNPMTVSDVIALSKASVGDSVVIAQIQATHSLFALSNQEIIDLKNAGISEKVITAMIKTNAQSGKRDSSYVYVPYRYYSYPRSYWGFSLGWGHYYGGRIGGHHLSGHAVGGHGFSRGHTGSIGRPRSFGRR